MTELNQPVRWTYRCLKQPPRLGTIPFDGLISCNMKPGTTITGHKYYGSVIYNRELSEEEKEQYGLAYVVYMITDGGENS